MVKLLVPSFPNSKAFFTLFSSLGFRPIITTPTTAASIKKLAFSYRFNIARASSSSTQIQMNSEKYTFGPYKIDSKEVFCSTDLSYAMVNLRPLLPGHILSSQFQDDMLDLLDVLVCPRREVKRFVDLTADETSDLWIMAQKVGHQLEHHHKASSLTFAIQDGPQAGQTVPHVHIHIIPRKSGDFENNDEIYEAIDEKEKELKAKLDLDKERKDRTLEEMAMEADEYRKLLL